MKTTSIVLLLLSTTCFGDICAFTPNFRSIKEEIRFNVIKEKYFITPTSDQLNMVHGDIQQSIKVTIEHGSNGRNRNQGGVIASANGVSQPDNKRCLEFAYRELIIKCRDNNKNNDYSIECTVYNDNCSLGYYF